MKIELTVNDASPAMIETYVKQLLKPCLPENVDCNFPREGDRIRMYAREPLPQAPENPASVTVRFWRYIWHGQGRRSADAMGEFIAIRTPTGCYIRGDVADGLSSAWEQFLTQLQKIGVNAITTPAVQGATGAGPGGGKIQLGRYVKPGGNADKRRRKAYRIIAAMRREYLDSADKPEIADFRDRLKAKGIDYAEKVIGWIIQDGDAEGWK